MAIVVGVGVPWRRREVFGNRQRLVEQILQHLKRGLAFARLRQVHRVLDRCDLVARDPLLARSFRSAGADSFPAVWHRGMISRATESNKPLNINPMPPLCAIAPRASAIRKIFFWQTEGRFTSGAIGPALGDVAGEPLLAQRERFYDGMRKASMPK
jgi:hypothetical protein